MEIRLLTEADAAIYRVLRLRALRENPEAFGATYDEWIGRPLAAIEERLCLATDPPERFTLGAFDEGALAGTVTFGRAQVAKERHKGVITGMFVAPEQRGRRLGSALMAEAIARARALPGLEQILLAVVTTNVSARALYTALGFQSYGLEHRALKHNGHYYDEHLMVLWLARE